MHDVRRRMQPLKAMIAYQMRRNAVHTRTKIREGAPGNDCCRRHDGQRMQLIANGLRQNGRMPVLDDSRQRAVEIEGEQRFDLAGQSIQNTPA